MDMYQKRKIRAEKKKDDSPKSFPSVGINWYPGHMLKTKKQIIEDLKLIDVIVEILNPKNYDVVHSYNIDNIVISNRYISKMVTQIGQKIELYEFYEDILTYDTEGCEEYESKEVYIKPVKGFLYGVPPKCKVRDLIYAVYECSPEDNKSYLMGVARHGGTIELFCGDKSDEWIELLDTDKLIIYSNH